MEVTKRYRLYRPREWQKAIHSKIRELGDNTSSIIVVKSRRQIGKSLAVENECLRYAINKKGSVVMIISPTLGQSRKIFDDIIKATGKTDIIKSANAQIFQIELINGSKIIFKSSQQGDSIRGYTVDYLLIDESAYLSDDFINILLPLTDVKKANILMTSTPRFKSGLFYTYYTMGMDEGYPKIHSLDLCEFDTSEFLSEERLDFYRKTMPAVTFTQEYLGQFAESESVIFGSFQGLMTAKATMDSSEYLYGGIDYGNGTGEDDTVLSVLNENGEQVLLEYWNNLTSIQSAARIATILRPYKDKIKAIYAENNSLGKPQIELLQRELPDVNIVGKNTSNSSKADMVSKLQEAFERKTIQLINDNKQTVELSSYSYEYNPNTGTITYNAPKGLHDDICIADMYSNLCKVENENMGYSIYIRK